MIDTEWIDGVAYHAQPEYLTTIYGEIAVDYVGEPLLYRMALITGGDGEPIPKTVCICAAHCDSECCCGAWSGAYDEDYNP